MKIKTFFYNIWLILLSITFLSLFFAIIIYFASHETFYNSFIFTFIVTSIIVFIYLSKSYITDYFEKKEYNYIKIYKIYFIFNRLIPRLLFADKIDFNYNEYNLFRIYKNNKYGLYSAYSNKYIIKPMYNSIDIFNDYDKLFINIDNYYELKNKIYIVDGNIAIIKSFDEIIQIPVNTIFSNIKISFPRKIFQLANSNNKYGLFSFDNINPIKLILPIKYLKISVKNDYKYFSLLEVNENQHQLLSKEDTCLVDINITGNFNIIEEVYGYTIFSIEDTKGLLYRSDVILKANYYKIDISIKEKGWTWASDDRQEFYEIYEITADNNKGLLQGREWLQTLA